MARRSEEQKKDRKVKMVIGGVLILVFGTGYAVGPGLRPIFLERARAHKTEPWAPVWMYRIGKLMNMTMREDQAKEVWEEFYLTYSGHDWEVDFEPVMKELHGEDWSKAYYLPWIMDRFDGLPGIDEDDPDIKNRRPAPASKERHPLMGKVLYEVGMNFERDRKYYESNHVWACLYHLWPTGSWENVEAAKARKRALQRSF